MINIFVGNLSFRATESDLRQAFEPFGSVSNVRIMTDRDSGRSRGFAFVNMLHLDDADEAIHRLNGSPLCGRSMTVNEAHKGELREHPSQNHKPFVSFLDSL